MKNLLKIFIPVLICLGTLYGLFWGYSRFQEKKKVPNGLLVERIVPGDEKVFPKWHEYAQYVPNSSVRYSGTKDGKTIFDVRFDMDKYSLRLEKSDTHEGKEHLILSGCSMIFGVGLNEQDTLSSKLRVQRKDLNVLNFGFGGGGLQSILRAMELIDLKKIAPQKKGKFVFFFTYDHLHRWLATPRYLAWAHPRHYHYEWKNGKLIGTNIENTEKYKNFMKARAAGVEEVYLRTGFDQTFHPEDIMSFVDGISELKKRYLGLYPSGKFVVMIYPYTIHYDILDQYLKEAGLEFYNEVPAFVSWYEAQGLFENSFKIPGEGHPTAAFNDYFSDVVLRRLGLK